MKRYILSALALLLCLTFICSCGGTSEAQDTSIPADLDLDACFEYTTEEYDGEKFCYITGTTALGKEQTVLEVPLTHDGVKIIGLESECFKDCTKLVKLTVHSNITDWYSNLFPGCTSLKKVYMDYGEFVKTADAEAIDALSAPVPEGDAWGSGSILEGMKNIRFVFTDAYAYDLFDTNYFWGTYSAAFAKEY